MLHSLRFPAQINPYHPDKYINFRSKFADALLNQPGTNTAKALLRAGVIVHPSFTMAGLIHDRYFSSVNRFAGLLGQSVSQRQMDFAAKLQRLQPLLNPEYVDNVSHLAGWANLTFEWYDITGQEISNDEEKQEALERIFGFLSDSETLDSPYVIGFYRIWKSDLGQRLTPSK